MRILRAHRASTLTAASNRTVQPVLLMASCRILSKTVCKSARFTYPMVWCVMMMCGVYMGSKEMTVGDWRKWRAPLVSGQGPVIYIINGDLYSNVTISTSSRREQPKQPTPRSFRRVETPSYLMMTG